MDESHSKRDSFTSKKTYGAASVSRLLKIVSFAKEPYKIDDILQKGPIILRSLLIVATPYWVVATHHLQHMNESHMNKSHRNESYSRRDSFVPNKTYWVVATHHLQHMNESHMNKSHMDESHSRHDSFIPKKAYWVVATDHLQHMNKSHMNKTHLNESHSRRDSFILSCCKGSSAQHE